MTRKHTFKLLILVALSLVLGASQIFAQSTVTGAIAGTVTDPQGGVVPNAAVTITNVGTNVKISVTTNSDGGYRATNLQPGIYRIEVVGGGFAPAKAENVTVEVGQSTTADIPLTVGTASAEVNITAEAPVVNMIDNSATLNINQTSINELPINGRRASNFVLASPGVVPDGNFGLYSFRGISGLLNNSTVDGGDDNQAFFSEARGRTRISYSISLDAVREFSVNTSNYSAEFGRAAGGVVNTVTKSGTNEFHGSGFYYLRDNKWGARNPLSFQTVLTPSGNQIIGLKPKDVRNQFGGSIGGPIVKNKLFFFFSYDEQRRDFPGVAAPSSTTFLNPITVAAPPAARVCPGITPGAGQTVTTLAGEILSCRSITQSQTDAGLAYIRSLTGEVERRGDQRLFLPKIDWVINSSNTFSAVYNRNRWKSPAGVQTAAVVNRGTTAWGSDFVELDSLNARLNSTITPSLINEARFQWSRDLETQFAQTPNSNEPTTANGFPPQVTIASGSGIVLGKPDFLDRAAYPDEKRYQFADTISWNRGKHSVKFGGDINHVSDTLDNLFQNSGVYSYSTLADFLSDFAVPSQKRYSSFNQGFGPTKFTFSTMDYNFFIQDNYQINPRFNLNVGLRYEYQKLPEPQIPNSLEGRTSVFPKDRNNFGPRVGFAYDVSGDGKTSLRGGYGIYYGRIINSTISNAITNTGVANSQKQFQILPAATGSPLYPNVLSAAPTTAGLPPDIVVFSPNMEAPMIHQSDIVLERLIGANTVLSFSALFSAGRDLPTFVDTNLGLPTGTTTFTYVGGPFSGTLIVPKYAGTRPNTNFGRITEIRNTIKSQYTGLIVQLNRRFTDGIQFQTSYTWSHSTDNNQISQTFTNANVPLDANNLDGEWGVSNFDIPHRFVASMVYAPKTLFGIGGDSTMARRILGGFSIAPIVTISSGTPYSYNVNGNAPNPGISTGILRAGGANRLLGVPRNTLRTERTANVDLRISRRFNFTETMALEILGEGFNIFNRFQVTGVNTTAYAISGTNLNFSSSFGNPTSAGNSNIRERQIQFAARFHF
jgi:hypothetical protein